MIISQFPDTFSLSKSKDSDCMLTLFLFASAYLSSQ